MFTVETIAGAFAKVQALRRETADRLVRNKILKHADYSRSGILYGVKHGVFGHTEDGFTYGLISELNRFLRYVHHADCWIEIADKYNEDDRLQLLSEFAEPLLESSMGRPYSLKSQFVLAAARLLHQTNWLRQDWKENALPSDCRIKFRDLLRLGRGDGRKSFPQFQKSLEALCAPSFQAETKNFRHLSQHRLRLRFDIGLTPYVERSLKKGRENYVFRAIRPLELRTLIPMLYDQHEKALKVLGSYWELVNELYAEWAKNNPAKRTPASISIEINSKLVHPTSCALRDS